MKNFKNNVPPASFSLLKFINGDQLCVEINALLFSSVHCKAKQNYISYTAYRFMVC